MEQSRERSNALPLHLDVVAIEKGAFGSPLTTVTNFLVVVVVVVVVVVFLAIFLTGSAGDLLLQDE